MVLDISNGKFVDHDSWRIEMLANNSGFPISQGRDEFGRRFSGPGLNQKSISIRWVGEDTLAMRVPSSVSLEMRKDAESGAHYSVDDAGMVVFGASGPDADKAIRRAAALIRALPDTPLTTYLEKTRTMPASTEAERLVKRATASRISRRPNW
jgi:hypothetical protein